MKGVKALDCGFEDRNEEQHIGRYINHLSKNIRYAANSAAELTAEGITGEQCRLMSYIRRRTSKGECVYQKDIECVFGVKRSSVASILGNMEKSGFIKRSIDDSDGRLKRVVLTEKGVMLEKKLYENIIRIEQTLSNGMTEEEASEFIRLTKLAISNIEKSGLLGKGNFD